MKKLLLIALLCLCAWVGVYFLRPAPKGSEWHSITPAELADFQNKQQEWKADLESKGRGEDYDFYSGEAKEQCGSYLCARVDCDMDGDGQPDQAFFRVNSNHSATRIIVRMSAPPFKEHLLTENSYIDGGFGISAAAPGKYSRAGGLEDDGTPDHIVLGHCGVQLEYYGKSTVVYYYDAEQDKFKEIWTSD